MNLDQSFADLVNDVNARIEAAFRSAGGTFDMTTSDATLAASIVSDEMRPTFMMAAHRLLCAAERVPADGPAGTELVEAAQGLRGTYPPTTAP